MRKIIILLLTTTLLYSCDRGSSSKPSNDAFNKSKLDSLLNLLHENDKFMGTVTLSQKGDVVYSKTIGFDDLESKKKSTTNTKYRIASTSKMFTATLIFKAIEENKLDLEQRINQYFPRIENADKITIRNLLSHRSGIHSFTKDSSFFTYRTQYKSPNEMVDIISKYKSDFEPDSKVEYSNSNYFLLSVILEKIYEKPFGDLLIEKICEPLDLKNTYYGSTINLANNEANSYTFNDTNWIKEIATDLSTTMGSGGIISTSYDLTKFLEGLFQLKIVSANSLQAMMTIQDNHGMGLLPFDVEDKSGFGHGGILEGFRSYAVYFPEDSLAIGITSNAIDYNFARLLRDVTQCYFNIPFSLPEFGSVDLSSEELEKYVGIYSQEGRGKFTITRRENTLYSQLNDFEAYPMIYKGNHTFLMEDNGAEFKFNLETGELSLVQIGVANAYVYMKE
ncbi:MAG: beta-lactamase family protein [Algoriphagus sp.]|uniref:serine hydrolase domain-containing protein n=1 Tax=Algoriphagus sp. TaxID=1872435 RepID=UPI0017D4B0B0|nr:serine hydrolase domain-containing protein [Algoriphagus sp.]NVJ85774.1 beta-lactamase family protein [Algoriphagus sp.]